MRKNSNHIKTLDDTSEIHNRAGSTVISFDLNKVNPFDEIEKITELGHDHAIQSFNESSEECMS